MSDQPLYRWLDQQGEAFGAPGMPPRWTSSVKDAVGTAYSASSRVWFTCSHGILNEIYHPTIDHAQVRDMEFLVSDGETFVHEEKRDLLSTFEYIHPEALGVRYINRDPDGRYTLTKEIICDPHHSVLLTQVRLEGDKDLVPQAEGLCAAGAASRWRRRRQLGPRRGRSRLSRAAGVEGPVVSGHGRQLRICQVSCGFVGASDGWKDLKDHRRMEWEFGSATNGNSGGDGRAEPGVRAKHSQRRGGPAHANLPSPSALATPSTRRCKRRSAR